MAQATESSTTSRLHFSSAGAVRRARHAAALPAVTLAHHVLIGALAAETPHQIIHNADRFDIMERRDHLKTVLAAVTAYAKAIVAHPAELAPIGYVADETGYLTDAASEIGARSTRRSIACSTTKRQREGGANERHPSHHQANGAEARRLQQEPPRPQGAAVGVGAVAITLTALGLSHLAHGIEIVTGCQSWEGWAMAIGIDLGFVALELSQLAVSDKLRRQVSRFARPAILGTLAGSAAMNAFAFAAQTTTAYMMAAAVALGIAIPSLIYSLTRVGAALATGIILLASSSRRARVLTAVLRQPSPRSIRVRRRP